MGSRLTPTSGYFYKLSTKIYAALEYRIKSFISNSQSTMAAYGLPMTYDHKRLLELKDKHVGEIGFLIGNGPSVRTEDLEQLKLKTSFCCNRFYLAYDQMDFRPTYTVSSDIQMIEDFGQEITEKSSGKIFICSEKKPDIDGHFTWIPLKNIEIQLNRNQLYYHIYQTGATLLASLQIGYFMGIRKFILYGVDHEFNYEIDKNTKDMARYAIGDKNHFIQDYRSGKAWAPPLKKLIEESFIMYNELLASEGGWIKNATRGGKLEVVERIDYDLCVDMLNDL